MFISGQLSKANLASSIGRMELSKTDKAVKSILQRDEKQSMSLARIDHLVSI